jgi:hypothetical protein
MVTYIQPGLLQLDQGEGGGDVGHPQASNSGLDPVSILYLQVRSLIPVWYHDGLAAGNIHRRRPLQHHYRILREVRTI